MGSPFPPPPPPFSSSPLWLSQRGQPGAVLILFFPHVLAFFFFFLFCLQRLKVSIHSFFSSEPGTVDVEFHPTFLLYRRTFPPFLWARLSCLSRLSPQSQIPFLSPIVGIGTSFFPSPLSVLRQRLCVLSFPDV